MLRMGIRLLCLFVMLSTVLVNVPSMRAQTQNTGAIQGRVFESGSLAPLAGATVTITHEELGLERTTVTDPDGIYYVGILPAGRYTITAGRQGYETDVNPQNSMIRGFLIHITNTERADQPPPIVLRKISATPTPTPAPPVTPPPVSAPPRPATTAAAPEDEVSLMVNITNATRGANFDELFLLSLPLPGVRSFDNLAFLAPGVAPPPQHIGTTVGPGIGPGVGTAGEFSVNGLRSRSNNFTIDGADNNDEDVGVRRQGFTSLVPQSIESVQEFQISTLLPEPQYGRNMGAQVNAVSRSGGSGYHGTIYGFLTDRRLNARDPFEYKPANSRSVVTSSGQTVLVNNGTGDAPLTVQDFKPRKNPYTRAQYGFVLGGPIASQKTHFFISFERQDINASKTAHFAVPTVADRGVFGTGDKGLTIGGVDSFSTSITGNAFTSLFPFPNNPFGPYRTSTYTEVLPASAEGNIFSAKLDRNIKAFGRDHSLTGRYNFTDDDTILPVTGEALFSSLRALVRTQNLAISFNSALSGRAANQFRFSFGRTNLEFEEVRNPFLIPSTLLSNTPFLLNAPLLLNVSIRNTNGTPGQPRFLAPAGFDTESGVGPIEGLTNTGTGRIGQVAVSGYSPVGVDVFNFPQGRTNNLFQYADTLIFNLRKHRLTAGFDIRRSHLNSFLDRNFRPLAVFSGAVDVAGLTLPLQERLPQLIGRNGSPVCVEAACFYIGRDYLAAGAATGFFQTLSNGGDDSNIRLRYWQYNFFLSDQIRISERFTLTAGARYEFNTVPTEVDRRIESTFSSPLIQAFADLERASTATANQPGVSGFEQFLAGRTKIYNSDKNNIAPYMAFAWDPFGDGKTSIRGGYGIYYDQILGSVISQSRNVFPRFLTINLGGFNQFANVDNPSSLFLAHPFIPVNPATAFAAPGTLNTYTGMNPVRDQLAAALLTNFASGPGFILPTVDLETPYAQHWGLTLERQLRKDVLLSAAYVGTRGVHLLRVATPNLGPNAIPVVQNIVVQRPISSRQDLAFPAISGISLPPNIQGRALRPFPLLGSFTSIESDANSIYHALQLQAVKRFSRGFQLTAAYTWSHAIDEVSDIFDLAGARALPQDSFSRRAEREDANFDVRHRFVYSFVWDLPFFGQSKILGGWQLASIGTFQTGQPYSVLFCCDLNLDGNLTDRVEPDPGAIPPIRDVTTAARNTYRAPGISTVDVALNKHFRFTERQRLEFRTEVFNLFNRENFGIPIHQLFFGGYSFEPSVKNNKLFTDTRVPMRTVQFALKYSF
jgi:Carboxypeptidase regulatory-like domain/TonB dependent receptor